jgi:hypothetical protein
MFLLLFVFQGVDSNALIAIAKRELGFDVQDSPLLIEM